MATLTERKSKAGTVSYEARRAGDQMAGEGHRAAFGGE
jgi:hypothetical protein